MQPTRPRFRHELAVGAGACWLMARFRFLLHDPLNGSTLQLRHPPRGWKSSGVTLARGKGGGIQASYTEQLEFVKEGKAAIDAAYEARGQEAEMLFRSEEEDTSSSLAPSIWQPFYEGQINFTNYRSERLVTLTQLEQKGFRQQLLSAMDTPVDLLGDVGVGPTGLVVGPPPTPITTTLPSRGLSASVGANLPGIVSNLFIQETGLNPQFGVLSSGPYAWGSVLTFSWNITGANELQASEGDVAMTDPHTWLNTPDAIPVLMRALDGNTEAQVSFRIKGMLTVLLDTSGVCGLADFDKGEFWLFLEIFDEDGTRASQTLIDYVFDDPIGGNWNKPIDMNWAGTLNLTTGQVARLVGVTALSDVASGGGCISFGYTFTPAEDVDGNPESFLTISSRTTYPDTPATGLLYYEALTRAVELLTGQASAVRSSILQRTDSVPALAEDGLWGLMGFFDGWRLRQFPLDKKPFITTLGKLLEAVCVVTGAGWGIETDALTGQQVVVIEPRTYFYPLAGTPDLVFACPEGVAIEANPKYVYNEAEIGFARFETETTNGLDDHNGRNFYALPITREPARYTALCPYIASTYSIELTRTKPYQTGTNQDTSYDNEGFLLLLVRDDEDLVVERDEYFDAGAFSNLLSPPDAFNLRLMPSLIALRHLDRLSPSVARLLPATIRCVKADGNGVVGYELLADGVARTNQEHLSVTTASALPDTVTATVPADYTTRRSLMENPYQLIGLEEVGGRLLMGAAETIKLDPGKNQATLTLQRLR